MAVGKRVGNRARARELLTESERLEKELWSLTERLLVFTEVLQAQLADHGERTEGDGDHV